MHPVVERFLVDAESAARNGDRALALVLLELALDVGGGDRTTLLRAQAVRNMLPASDLGATTSTAPAIPELPDFPDVADLLLEVEESPILQEARRDVARQVEATAREAARRQAEEAALIDAERAARARVRARLLRAAWVLITGLLFVGGGFAVRPTIGGDIAEMVRRRLDPLARAEAALAARAWHDAERLAREAIARAPEDGSAYLVLGQAVMGRGDAMHAREALRQAVRQDSTWRVALEAARLQLTTGDTTSAADAYQAAFERGAPGSAFREIAHGLALAGRTDPARYIEELAARAGPLDTAPDTGPR